RGGSLLTHPESLVAAVRDFGPLHNPRAHEAGMMGTVVTTVFLLDDHELVRRGVRELLSAYEDLAVVGEASTAEEALTRIPQCRPDVAVLDVRLGGEAVTGVEVCREVRSSNPDVACIMLTSFADD